MNIKKLAKEADPGYGDGSFLGKCLVGDEAIERFAALVLEEAANAVDAMKAPDGYGIQEQSLYDVATMEAADVVRALKGAKE